MKTIRPLYLGLAVAALVATARADDPPRAENADARVVRGKIVEVSPQQNLLTVQPRKGEAVKLTVDERTKFSLSQPNAKLDGLRPGGRVRVTYETANTTNRAVLVQDALMTVDRAQGVVSGILNNVKSFEFRQRDEYRRKLDAALRDLDERIEGLEDRIEEATPEARQRAEREMEELRRKQAELRQRFDRVGSATAESWSDVQTGVNRAIDEVQRSIDRARSRFDGPAPERR